VALVVASLWVSLASVSLVAVAFPMLNKAVAFQKKKSLSKSFSFIMVHVSGK
jgi:uncharacterized protein (DUF934 family)